MSIPNLILSLVLGLLLVPVTFILVEVLSALRMRRVPDPAEIPGKRPSVVVLVPAHDEERVIEAALSAILPQLEASDRLVVIADNCSDSTADLAHKLGATVVERRDPLRLGKGYALQAGARYLESDPREVVIVIDADCVPREGAISSLARATAASERPTQAVYLMTAPAGSRREAQLAEALVLLKNFVRPAGLYCFHLSCLLTGSGMAFPWALFHRAPLGSGNRADDLQLTVDLAIAGAPPLFCPAAHVTGTFPAQPNALRLQLSAWLDGQLRTLFVQVPRLVKAAWRARGLDLAFLALELSVPPLSVLILLWTLASILAVSLCSGTGAWFPVSAAACGSVTLVSAGAVFWIRFGRERVPLRALFAIPLLFGRFIITAFVAAFTRAKPWIRTAR